MQHSAVTVTSIYRENYWNPQWGIRLNSSNIDHIYSFRQTPEEMGIQRKGTSVI